MALLQSLEFYDKEITLTAGQIINRPVLQWSSVGERYEDRTTTITIDLTFKEIEQLPPDDFNR